MQGSRSKPQGCQRLAALWVAAVLATGCATLPRADAAGESGLGGELREGAVAGAREAPPLGGAAPSQRRRRQQLRRRQAAPLEGTRIGPVRQEEAREEAGAQRPARCGGTQVPEGWPDYSGEEEELLGPFLECTSPAEFIELQREVDMRRVVEALGDWGAVRLGALGPLRQGVEQLQRKRVAFLVRASHDYGEAYAEVFALYVVHSAFTAEVRQVLELLGQDKRLGQTVGRMPAVKEALRLRGVDLSAYEDRAERWGDVGRGLALAAGDVLDSSPLARGELGRRYYAQRGQLPAAYQKALDEVELAPEQLSGESLALGCLDEMTLGVPLGFYNLVAGTCHGVYALSQGKYEQGTREVAAAAVVVALYAGGKAVRFVSEGGASSRWAQVSRVAVPELGFEGLGEVAQRVWARLGESGLVELARYIQADGEAALLVYEGGEAGAFALYEAKGNVAQAQAHLSEARPQRAGAGAMKASTAAGLGEVASLVDEAAGLTAEVVEAKLVHLEREATGPRLPAEVEWLKGHRPTVQAPGPGVPEGYGLWGEYVAYWERRLAQLEEGATRQGPLRWEAYEQMRGLFARGLAYERAVVATLRADAELPRSQRRWLQDFHQPRIEVNVGVAKPGVPGVRFVDVLVIEDQPPASQSPRVESFSLKSRNFNLLERNAVKAQVQTDASDALSCYGGVLDIRRPALKYLGPEVPIRRVRLLYQDGNGEFTRGNLKAVKEAVKNAQNEVPEVEVLFK